jgi:hypothetical protein
MMTERQHRAIDLLEERAWKAVDVLREQGCATTAGRLEDALEELGCAFNPDFEVAE